MAEDDQLFAARAALSSRERAAEEWRRAEHVEKLRGDPRALDQFRIPWLRGERHHVFAKTGERLERPVVALQIEEIARGVIALRLVLRRCRYPDDARLVAK